MSTNKETSTKAPTELANISSRNSSTSEIDKHSINSSNSNSNEKKKTKFRWQLEDDGSPPEIYNWTLYLSVFVFGILGSARGLDEGSISGSLAQVSFRNLFGLEDESKSEHEIADLKSNIAAMVQLGSIGGSMIAMYSVDKLGRIRALHGVCIIWILAVIIQITSKTVGQLYAGRLLEGLAIGQTTTIGPTYMSEVAPKRIRGRCGCIFAGAVYLGIMLSYFAHYGTALHIDPTSRIQWVAPTSLKIIFAGLIFILSFCFCVESPRWLIKVGKYDLAVKKLSKLRGLPADHPYVLGELADINHQVTQEREARSNYGILDRFKDLFCLKSIRYRFFVIGCGSQLLGQWSGANAVTIYAPELFSFSGIRGVEKMKMTAILGVVKFCSAYLSAFLIIDFLGRRMALYIGITIQLLSILYFAIFLTVVPQATHLDVNLTTSQYHASKGAVAALFISGTGWTMGFNSVQYLLGSEIFPLRFRSFGQSMIMVVHFANQYGNSKALPKMLLAMENSGAFFFFVGVCLTALFWAWFFIPEISGRSLESMEELFSLPWYLIGRRGPKLCPDHSELDRVTHGHTDDLLIEAEKERVKAEVDHIEGVSPSQKPR